MSTITPAQMRILRQIASAGRRGMRKSYGLDKREWQSVRVLERKGLVTIDDSLPGTYPYVDLTEAARDTIAQARGAEA